jgi:hypothetical protein
MLARQLRVLLVPHAQQLLPQSFKGCRASCQAFDNLDALYLLDAVEFVSRAALAPKLAIRQCLKHRQCRQH